MAHSDALPPGPDLSQGVPLSSVPVGGVLAGHVAGEAVLLARLDDGFHAVSGSCTHYGAPLAEGLVTGDRIHCPWHHACFSLRTGAALGAPAFSGLDPWQVEVDGGQAFVRTRLEDAPVPTPQPRTPRERIVIIGGGAAGFAAAQRLRTLGHAGSLALLSADDAGPYDRPNLSKDYLAGTAPEDWIPLRDDAFYADQRIDLRLRSEVVGVDAAARQVRLASGETFDFDVLLIATGAEPRRLPLPGFDRSNVYPLRSLDDARAIIRACEGARSVALIGAGFIGLEAAGALRARGLDVHVVAPDAVPLERIVGAEVGRFIADLHEEKGVRFHLRAQVRGFDGEAVELEDGTRVPADFVVAGVGVSPRTQVGELAGARIDEGIVVDERLRTSVAGIFAAGDVARFPIGGDSARIEHWVHAERQGQRAAANMLGADEPFDDVPFFWTHHQGVEVRYCGYAGKWDEMQLDGDLAARDFTARYFRGGKLVAAASVGRDLENLEIEEQLQNG